MRNLFLLLFSLQLISCGFDKSYISSVSSIGEKTHGPVRVISSPKVSIHIGPRNDIKTGEFNYVILPVLPVGGNSDEMFAHQQKAGRFVVQLSLFSHDDDLSLNFTDITLNIMQTNYKVIDVERNPYAYYSNSQARNSGVREVMCPESQQFSSGLPESPINLLNNGMWECYDLVFSVDTPSPRMKFQMEVDVKDNKSSLNHTFKVPFEAYEWGHSDSFP